MTNTRKIRLLLLASKPIDHKKYYSQYYKLINEGLVSWCIGHASLTDKGREYLENGEVIKE